MIFNYKKLKSGKVYVFGDLDIGETFMLSDPRKDITVFPECSVYMVVEDKDHAINLDTGHLLFLNHDVKVYPVICECSVTLYPDVY